MPSNSQWDTTAETCRVSTAVFSVLGACSRVGVLTGLTKLGAVLKKRELGGRRALEKAAILNAIADGDTKSVESIIYALPPNGIL